MAGDPANPRIWVNAKVLVAPVGTTAPTDIATAWSATWKDLGLLSEDGLTEARDQDVSDHYAWGGLLVRTVKSKHKRTMKVTALEDNPIVWGLVNPGSSASSASTITTRTIKVPTSDPRAFGMELLDGSVTSRLIIPRGEIIELGDVTKSDSELTMYELTINLYSASDGTLYKEITNDPQAVVP